MHGKYAPGYCNSAKHIVKDSGILSFALSKMESFAKGTKDGQRLHSVKPPPQSVEANVYSAHCVSNVMMLVFLDGELIFCGRAAILSTTEASDGHFLAFGFAAAGFLERRSWLGK